MRCPWESISPSDEVTNSKRLAFTSWATSAERRSLSPKRSSSTATVSFSLMTGTMFRVWKIRSIVLEAFCRRIRLSMSSCVSSSWATLTPCCLKALAYMRISSGWPAAAQACFPGRSSGRWSRPNMWTPAAIAALLTMTQEFPSLTPKQSRPRTDETAFHQAHARRSARGRPCQT